MYPNAEQTQSVTDLLGLGDVKIDFSKHKSRSIDPESLQSWGGRKFSQDQLQRLASICFPVFVSLLF